MTIESVVLVSYYLVLQWFRPNRITTCTYLTLDKGVCIANLAERAKVIMVQARACKQAEFVILAIDVHLARNVATPQFFAGCLIPGRSEGNDVFAQGGKSWAYPQICCDHSSHLP